LVFEIELACPPLKPFRLIVLIELLFTHFIAFTTLLELPDEK